jgi:hypothetical protein
MKYKCFDGRFLEFIELQKEEKDEECHLKQMAVS